ncbi:hypothetical protein EJ03DRAFT_31086 [Teratosphaeria nubilosa]|uniref:Uncharacterized protein n=1 Tax=Teratosphaeria nubilosa TaxID=161662 RepID=A0A6G1LHA7_9PEZI|nr:hypothetical protein EJ03DRAFT_31086 [Teratosphaeria nubilosa]
MVRYRRFMAICATCIWHTFYLGRELARAASEASPEHASLKATLSGSPRRHRTTCATHMGILTSPSVRPCCKPRLSYSLPTLYACLDPRAWHLQISTRSCEYDQP